MSMTPPQIQRILVPTDLSESARGALKYAAVIAEQHRAELHVVHVMTVHEYDPALAQDRIGEHKEALERLVARLEDRVHKEASGLGGKNVRVRTKTLRAVAAYDGILRYAQENKIDQIVMGTHGRTRLGYILLGSVADKVVRHAQCSVLVVNDREKGFVGPYGRDFLRRILYPTDLSPESRWAATRVLHTARAHRAELVVAHVIPMSTVVSQAMTDVPSDNRLADKILRDAERNARQEARKLFDGYPNLRVELRFGPVARALAELARAEKIDLIMMSSRGRDGWKDLIVGSVADRLLRLAPCPVCVEKRPPE